MKKIYETAQQMRCYLIAKILEFVIYHADIIAKNTQDIEQGIIFNGIIMELNDLSYIKDPNKKESTDQFIEALEKTMDNWNKTQLTDIVSAVIIKGIKFINKDFKDNSVREITELHDFICLVHTFIDSHWTTDDNKSDIHAALTKVIIQFGYPQKIKEQ